MTCLPGQALLAVGLYQAFCARCISAAFALHVLMT